MAEAAAESSQAGARESSASGAGGGPKPIILYILIIVNMLVVSGVGVMIYLGKKKEADKPTLDHVIQGEAQTQKEEAQKEEMEFIGKMIPLETFYVNLAGNRGNRLLKVNMELEVGSEKVIEEVDKRRSQIRDFIIVILSSKTFTDLETKEGKDSLRDEIRDGINSFLTKGKINRVHFTEFIYS